MRQFLEENTNTKVVLLPPKSPNLNACMERWFRSLKSECLERMIFFGRKSLEKAVREYVEHYHAERNHQGCIATITFRFGDNWFSPGKSVAEFLASPQGRGNCR
ncbi:MAG: integrase core domain-containing protein, partial [Pirellulaceae bacterium]